MSGITSLDRCVRMRCEWEKNALRSKVYWIESQLYLAKPGRKNEVFEISHVGSISCLSRGRESDDRRDRIHGVPMTTPFRARGKPATTVVGHIRFASVVGLGLPRRKVLH